MDASGLTALIEAGKQLLVLKLYIIAVHFLWVYDYFLTLGDEIKYAWNGKRSWGFVLFIANRYIPVLYIAWFSAAAHGYVSESFCQNTKWIPELHATLVAALSEITIALRIYAVTEKNKWLGGVLSCLIAAQLVFGIYFMVWIAARPTQQIPAIDLDVFRICISQPWKFGELLFVNIAVAFGASPTSDVVSPRVCLSQSIFLTSWSWTAVDVLAFLSILIAAKKSWRSKYPGIPSLLDAILRDATIYFIFTALSQVSSDIFLAFAPSSVQAFPGLASVILVPLMTSRLMLSLKKSAVGPTRVWSPSDPSLGTSVDRRSLRFASRVPGRPGGVAGTPIPLSVVEGGLGLESISHPETRAKVIESIPH